MNSLLREETGLPVEEALATLRDALRSGTSAVLQAPPGAGKTTRVPLALLDEPWLEGRRILILEPRRLAARAAARHMASLLGEPVGKTVGYRIRLETRVGPETRIEVVTEGVLTQLLQSDPALEGVGLVIFDEFHERSLHADLGLALCLQSRALLREDLRILAMSATLDGQAVARLLGDAPIITAEGRMYEVETRFLDRRVEGWTEPVVVRAILRALEEEQGDILVFLPGAAEIRRVAAGLEEAGTGPGVVVAPLYGNLPQEAQDRAIEPSREGLRKVVLATSIAETSLTIEGIRVVIDSGLMRVPRFSPRTGMTRLETIPVSRASADQRRGRAGRLGPGVCYRLWTEYDDAALAAHTKPEILEADLAPLALELAAWGETDPSALTWLDPPPDAAFAQARELLQALGALDGAGTITAHGREMAGLGLHPRLAHMLLRARELGLGAVACDLAALLGERDLFRGTDAIPDCDVRLRLEVLRSPDRNRSLTVDRGTLHRIREEAGHLRRRLGVDSADPYDVDAAGLLLAFAYPDRIAQRRQGQAGRYLLRNGRGAELVGAQSLATEPYIVAAELDGSGKESRIFLAAPLDADALERYFGEQIERESTIAWDAESQSVRARSRRRIGALILEDAPLTEPDADAVLEALIEGIASEGLEILPWSDAARRFQQRLAFLHQLDPSWPDTSDAALAATIEVWLAPYLYGLRSRADLQRLDLTAVLEAMLPWERRRLLDEYAPTHVVVPSGSRLPIDYTDPAAPVLAVRLQEMFGLQETPRIAGGTVPLTLHLLSPARRPVQVTRDLANFWKTTYFEVKKDLKGRYPKHYWPDDPLEAIPTHRVRPRT